MKLNAGVDDVIELIIKGIAWALQTQARRNVLAGALLAVILFHIGWVCGWFTPFGIGRPFIVRSEFAELQGQVKEILSNEALSRQETNFIKTQLIEGSIRAKLSTRCATSDQKFKAELSREIEKLETDYFAINHGGYKQPACDEL